MPADLLERFTAETGIEAELTLHSTNEEIMGKLTASGGKGYDVVFVSSPFVQALASMGIAARLDHGKLSNIGNLYAEAAAMPHDPGNWFSVPYGWGTTGLCYRSDLVSFTPDSWFDLLRPRGDRHFDAECAGRTDAEKYQAAVERQQQKHKPRSWIREEVRRRLREEFGGRSAD